MLARQSNLQRSATIDNEVLAGHRLSHRQHSYLVRAVLQQSALEMLGYTN